MNIVNICMGAPFTEGYTYQDSMLSDYQKRLGHDVTVITGLRTRDQNGKVVLTDPGESVLSNGVRLIRLAPKGLGKIAGNMLGVYPDIPQLLEKLAPDLIMVHGLGSHAARYTVKYRQIHSNACVIADNHQDYVNTPPVIRNVRSLALRATELYYRLRWKQWIRYVDKVYGVTSWRTRFAHEVYGIPSNKLDVLVLGIDDQYINLCGDTRNRVTIRERYGISKDAFLFCSGGKLDATKSILEMMRAFHQMQGDNLQYLIFGSVSVDIEQEFKRLLEQDSRMVYVGYVPSSETNSLLSAADFGLFAGLHSVLWEQAVGCGLPCLFRRYSENDHVNLGGNCIQIDTTEEDTILNIMRQVSGDADKYRTMKAAAEAAAEMFSYTAIAKKSVECAKK